MSLGRLLSAGKSLIGLTSTSRYELRTGTLPKFESTKNPFAPKPHAEASETQELSPAEMAAAHLKKTQRLPLLIPKPAVSGLQPARPAEGGKLDSSPPAEPCTPAQPDPLPQTLAEREKSSQPEAPAVVNSWVKKLNPLIWFESHKPAEGKPAMSGSSKLPVQGELSLENIRVVRNDLNEADVEVVPRKPAPMQTAGLPGAASVAAKALPELASAKKAWEFLGERLLGNH